MPFGSQNIDRLGRVGRPDRMRCVRLTGRNTFLYTDRDGNTHLKLHQTVVVSFNEQWITLRTGGWPTMMTRGRMNWASRSFDLGFYVGSDRGSMNVEFHGRWPFESETVSLNRATMEMVEGDKVPPADDLSNCRRGKIQNPPSRAKNIGMASDKSDDIDVEVEDQGSIILFKLVSDEAREWWREHVSKGPQFGGRYVVEHRHADSIVEGMMADGLNVR